MVLEYKTGLPNPEHVGQVQRYLGLLAAMPELGVRKFRGLLIYLDSKEIQEVAR
jgi:CRISPR/Cas system-associated exonuclease Cas4 (RecB family)